MRILGIDYGSKKIGLAVSDPLGITAQGVAVLGRTDSLAKDLQELKKIIKQFDDISEIVVGLPKTLMGELGEAAQNVLAFIANLKKEFMIKITPWDERLTTAGAEKMLISAGLSRKQRRQVVDKSAAALILQSYLDRQRSTLKTSPEMTND